MKRSVLVVILAACVPIAQAQVFAIQQLEESPRHHEWVEVQSGDRTVHSFVAYPERDDASLAVVVIHENRGLTDWVRSFADQLAARGYIAIAPDLLSEFDDGHATTRDFATSDAARDAIYRLESDQVTRDLHAVRAYVADLPASTGETVVMGFCWGGSQTFRFATASPDVEAALVFYGSPPDEGYENIETPVYGFYGENDERINATIPATVERMQKLGKTYEYEMYEGAGHAFMRQGDAPDASAESRQARDAAWERIERLLADIDEKGEKDHD